MRFGKTIVVAMSVMVAAGTGLRGQFPPAVANVTVAVINGAVPVAGATVALRGTTGTNAYAGVTGASGTFTFTAVADDTYSITASAPGTTVGTTSGIFVAGSPVSTTVIVASSATIFTGLNAFGATAGDIVADGRSGVFYMLTGAVPPIFRTHDYGATWAPVTISSDDANDGIDGSLPVAMVTTSGYPGEVAALSGEVVYFSRDFGVTWKSMSTGLEILLNPQILWGHAPAPGADSMLFLDTGTVIYSANMSAAAPTLSAVPASASYRTDPGDRLAIGNGSAQSFIAVAPDEGGSVTIYKVDTTPNRTEDASLPVPGAAATGGPPSLIRFGGNPAGAPIGGSAAPDTLLVFTYDTTPDALTATPNITMSIYEGGAYQPTTAMQLRNLANDAVFGGSPQAFFDDFGVGNGAPGSVSPAGTFGLIGQLWVERSGATVLVRPLGAFPTGKAFDAEFGKLTNRVIVGSTTFGAIKSARMNATLNRPDFPGWPTQASAGIAELSGGVSINGLNAAVVGDVVFQPGSSANIVAGLSHEGGDRVVGSTDSGANWFTLEARSGVAVDWWNASSGQWILTGTTGARVPAPPAADNMLSAVKLADAGAFNSTTTTTAVAGTRPQDFGLSGPPDGAQVRAIAGLAGTDKAVIAATQVTDFVVTKAVLYVVTLGGPVPGLANLGVALPAGTAPVAMAYCPALGSSPSVADRLFVAVAASGDGDSDGKIFTVAAPAGTPIIGPSLAGAATGDFRDVRVDCASGTVFAGRYAGFGTGLMKATTTGTTLGSLTPVTLPFISGGRQTQIATLDIEPGNASRVVAVSAAGDVFLSTNGTTFQLLNNTATSACTDAPPCGRSFGALPPGDIEIGPFAADAAPDDLAENAAAIAPGQALFGSGAGLYAVNLTPPGVPGTPGVPVNFQVLASGLNLLLAWSPPAGGTPPTGYVVQASTASSFTPIVFSQPVTGTSLAVTAPPGTTGTFFLRVHATNATGPGPATTGVPVTLPAELIPPPGAPGTPSVQVLSSGRIEVTWTAPEGGVPPHAYRGHLVFNGAPFPGSPFLLPSAATSVQTPVPVPNGSYTVAISAINIGGDGPPSAATPFIVGGPPGAPGTPQVTVNGNRTIVVAWAPASGVLTSYKAYVTFNGSAIPGSPFALGPGTAVASPPLAPGSYSITIAAVNGASEGPPSPATDFTISVPTVPGTPVVTVHASGSVSVSWAPSTGGVSTYRVHVARNGAPFPGTPFNVGAAPAVTSPGPLPSGNYLLTVSALNTLGESAQSAGVTFTVP